MKIPYYSTHFPWPKIIEASNVYGVDLIFLSALIQTESEGNQYAFRYEPDFDYLHDTNKLQNLWKCTKETANMMQKCSYGLTQVMGATALDLGLLKENNRFPWPTLLYDIEVNLKYCCKLVLQKTKIYGKGHSLLYASYNAGTPIRLSSGLLKNQGTVDRFDKFYIDFSGKNKKLLYVDQNNQ
jgi:soluble lytic murein transglycosylase-like protein